MIHTIVPGLTGAGLTWEAAPVNEVIDTAFLLPNQ